MRISFALSLLSLSFSLLFLLAAQGVRAHPAGTDPVVREERREHLERALNGESNKPLAARQDAATTASECSMTSRLGPGQSASWTAALVMSCCTTWNVSSCFERWQSNFDAAEQCIIPNCNDLASGDASLMHGFVPLSSSIGLGPLNNSFLIATGGATGSLVGRHEAMVLGGVVAALLGALALL